MVKLLLLILLMILDGIIAGVAVAGLYWYYIRRK